MQPTAADRPPVIAVTCGLCRHPMADLIGRPHGDGVVVLGSLTGPSGATMHGGHGRTRTGAPAVRRRRARIYDASADGRWHGTDPTDPPSAYRFVCEHRRAALGTLDQVVRADTLMLARQDASAVGAAAVEVTPRGERVTGHPG